MPGEYTETFEENLLKLFFSLRTLWQKGLLQEVYYVIARRAFVLSDDTCAVRQCGEQSHVNLEIASGKEHTCPGGRCQGERPRNDICFYVETDPLAVAYSLASSAFFNAAPYR